MSAHHSAPHGAPHGSVQIASFAGVSSPPPPEPPVDPKTVLQKKYDCTAIVLALSKILGLIIALSLWQTGNEAAGIVVLCVGYFSTYFLVLLGSFLDTKAFDLNIEVKYLQLYYQYTLLKFALVLQIACIYLQRAIVPDLWIYGIAYVIFLIMTLELNKSLWKLYKEFENKKIYVFILIGCVSLTFISQTIYFGLLGSAYTASSMVQTKLPIGALFVPIFFGQIANIVMIVMTKNWEVKSEVSGTEV